MTASPSWKDRPAPQEGLLVEHVWVDPDTAAEWLGRYNESNYRPIQGKHRDKFVGLLQRGEFCQTGEPVQFSGYIGTPGCRLDNGQHRLAAIAKSGIGAPLLVVQGIDSHAMLYMDTGKPRSFSDYLRHRGEREYRLLASTTRLGCQYETDAIAAAHSGNQGVPFDVMLEYYDRNVKAMREHVTLAKRVSRNAMVNRTTALLAACILYDLDAEDADGFFKALETGAGLAEQDPILALRRWFANAYASSPRPRAGMQLAVIFKAWNYARAGRAISLMRWRTVGSGAERFPHPS